MWADATDTKNQISVQSCTARRVLWEFFLQVSTIHFCYVLHRLLVQNLQLAGSEIFVGIVQNEIFTRTKNRVLRT
jgi:hypothetical protein